VRGKEGYLPRTDPLIADLVLGVFYPLRRPARLGSESRPPKRERRL